LARALRGYDVIHTTDAYFAYARTARRVAAREGIALVNSIHTNTPDYARIYTALTIRRLFGQGVFSQFLLDRLALAERVGQRMVRQLAEHNRRAAFVFVSRPDQLPAAQAATGGRAGLLRRGIDRAFFNPAKRDRAWLAREFGIGEDSVVLLFVGRLDRAKNVALLAEAVAKLIGEGLALHLICAGAGEERGEILRRLGGRASCPGNVERERLARLYASADLFTFPSAVEESANVVLEALASGLAVLVSREGGMGRVVEEGRTGLILPGDAAEAWREAIGGLAGDPARRACLSADARRYAESRLPSWADVLRQDLLPRWNQAALAMRLEREGAAAGEEGRNRAA
jgi:glycosyltransferase involved in cell wall biosynthesis